MLIQTKDILIVSETPEGNIKPGSPLSDWGDIEKYDDDVIYFLSASLIEDIMNFQGITHIYIYIYIKASAEIYDFFEGLRDEDFSNSLRDAYVDILKVVSNIVSIPKYENLMYSGISTLKEHKDFLSTIK